MLPSCDNRGTKKHEGGEDMDELKEFLDAVAPIEWDSEPDEDE